MKAVIQRVKSGKVRIGNKVYSQINYGYVIFLGIFEKDNTEEVDKLINKIIHLRIMPDNNNKMNKSVIDISGEILVVSQFTLCAELDGRRPSFFLAKKPDEAEKLYKYFVNKLAENKLTIKTGKFGTKMEVEIINDGPVTILLDSISI